jgi:DNA-binding MarR family transcriptional regulator
MQAETAAANRREEELAPSLIPALLKTAKLVRAVMSVNLSELGLQIGQDEVLLAFEKARPMSSAQLGAKLGIRADTASKLLARLVQQRLAMRVENLIDARQMVVVITASGQEMQDGLRRMMARIDQDLNAALNAKLNGETLSEVAELNARLAELLTPHP